jgi:DNA-binding transcriptional regulator YiaG
MSYPSWASKLEYPNEDGIAVEMSSLVEVFGMSPKQYKAIIEQLGLSQQRAGEWLGVSARTGQNYAAKGPPEPVAKLLRLMIKHGFTPEDVK